MYALLMFLHTTRLNVFATYFFVVIEVLLRNLKQKNNINA